MSTKNENTEYFSRIGKILTTAEVEDMTEEEFEDALLSSEERPLFLVDESQEMAVCLPESVFNGLIGDLAATYKDM